jgi:hypothetical protein
MANSGRPLLDDKLKCNKKIILYVTDEEKQLYQKRAKEKQESVSSYIRQHLYPLTRKLYELYEAATQKEKQ